MTSLPLAPEGLDAPAHTLSAGVVLLYTVDPATLRDPRLLAQLASWLAPAEEARRARFRFARDRHVYLVCWGLVRAVLAWHTGVPPARLRFERSREGRPELRECPATRFAAAAQERAPGPEPSVRFSLSRSRGLIALAVTRRYAVGVDVENAATAAGVEAVAEWAFSPAEVEDLRALAPVARREAAVRLWTLKEAYLKARGLGLAGGLDTTRFASTPDGRVRASFAASLADRPALWQFTTFRPTSRHRVSLAVRRGRRPDCEVHWHALVLPPTRRL